MLGPETPCEPWIVEADLCCDTEGVDPLIVAAAILTSTEYLYDRTCRRWPGTTCTATVRPCLPCDCVRDCCCHWTKLPIQAPYPILEILAFEVDGIDQSAFVRLDNNRDLTLLEGAPFGSCFPAQNMSLADGAVGTWSLQYRFGAAPLEMAKRAAGDLACELIRTCPGGDCDEPENLESVTKRGATFRFRLPSDGVTNIKSADWLIDAYGCPNPGTPRIIDPAIRPHVYRGP